MAKEAILTVKVDGNQAASNLAILNARIEDLKNSNKELTASQKELDKQYKEGTVSQKQYTQQTIALSNQLEENKKDLKELGGEYRAVQKAELQTAQSSRALEGSVEQMRLELAQVTTQWTKLSKAERENGTRGKELVKRKKELTEELKRVEAATGDNRRNVGNYSDALKDLDSSLSNVVPGLGGMTNGLRSALTAAKAFIATPIGLILGAVAAALGSVLAYFKRTEEGQQTLNKITTVLSVTFGNFLDIISKLGKSIFEAFENPKQTIIDFGNTIKGFFIDRIVAAVEGIGLAGKAISQLFSGDFKDALDTAGQAAEKLFVDANPVTALFKEGVDSVTTSFKNLGNEISNDIVKSKQLADSVNQLAVKERKILVENAKLNQDISELRLKAAEKEAFTAEERIQFLDEAIELEKQRLNNDLEISKQRLDNKILENSLNDSTTEDLKEQSQLQAEYINLQTSSNQRLKTIAAERVTAIREINREEEEAAKLRQKEIEDNLKAIEKQAEAEQKAADLKAKADKKAADEKAKNQIEANDSLLNSTSDLFGELGKKNRAFALAQIAADTARAISGAIAQATAPNVIFPANIAAIITGITAVLGGAAQAKAVLNEGFAEGGFTGNGGKYEPAGIVHKGEWVGRSEFVKSNPDLFNTLESMQRGYASGGFVAMASNNVSSATIQNDALENIVNKVVDKVAAIPVVQDINGLNSAMNMNRKVNNLGDL